MSRGLLRNDVTDAEGNAVQGALVTVYVAGTLTKATLYSESVGGVIIANPLTTDVKGVFQAFVETGEYDLAVVTAAGTENVYNIPVLDADDVASIEANLATSQQQIDDLTAISKAFVRTPEQVISAQTVVSVPEITDQTADITTVFLNGSAFRSGYSISAGQVVFDNPQSGDFWALIPFTTPIGTTTAGAVTDTSRGQSVQETVDPIARSFPTVAAAKAASYKVGDVITIEERAHSHWKYEASGTTDEYSTIEVTAGGRLVLDIDTPVTPEHFGQVTTDNTALLQAILDWAETKNTRHLIIDGHDFVLGSVVNSAVDNLTIEFRNGGKISQPVPASNTDWNHQRLVLVLTGDNVKFINLEADGKYDNTGLNEVPSPVNKFIQVFGDNAKFKGKTIVRNSGGYGLDVYGDFAHFDQLENYNNAYSGTRLVVNKDMKKFSVDTYYGRNEFNEIGRKNGITVNGKNFIDLIEIGSYKGHNAALFTEADATGADETKYYRSINIGYFDCYTDQDVKTPAGAVASTNIGKIENAGTMAVDICRLANDAPLDDGQPWAQNFWFIKLDSFTAHEFYFDGPCLMPRVTKLGKAVYTYNNSVSSELLEGPTGGWFCDIEYLEVKCEPADDLSSLVGALRIQSNNDRAKVGRYVTTNNSAGLVRSSLFVEPNVVVGHSDFPISTHSYIPQSIGSFMHTFQVLNPERITRDVTKGEVFLFTNNGVFRRWEVTKSGTIDWTDGKPSGTAEFEKVTKLGEFSAGDITALTNYLIADDAGLSIVAAGATPRPIFWQGEKWVYGDGLEYGATYEASITDLQSATHPVNTQDKSSGRQVFETDNNRPAYATGSSPTDIWVYSDGTTAATPIYTHDGANNSSVLTDSTQSWAVDELVGDTVTNVTDGSSGTITANTATTVTATLAGGTDNDWDTGDEYTIS